MEVCINRFLAAGKTLIALVLIIPIGLGIHTPHWHQPVQVDGKDK